ncbi:MAG TPA: ATP-binding cassette domain-containing protein [Solirubrobacterales bacterium]|nr:ATP-binding cassette domain-containing protein [Solirubrobacterales bacterium]
MEVDRQPRPAIELAGVVKSFGRERVLDGVDLTIPAGAITVLLGPSGAGKTATISHVVGLLSPDRGAVYIGDRNLVALGDAELNEVRQSMAVVLQGTLPFTCGLFFSLTVYENVAFALRQRNRWSEERVRQVTMEYLGMVGLADRAGDMPEHLSAGMCKRVAIARALALEARIVLIDDFDSGIDGVRLSLLCGMITEIQRETGATFLVSTHHMSAARRLADYVAVIHDGRIVASGEAEAVLGSSDPLVRQLVAGDTSGPIQLADV